MGSAKRAIGPALVQSASAIITAMRTPCWFAIDRPSPPFARIHELLHINPLTNTIYNCTPH